MRLIHYLLGIFMCGLLLMSIFPSSTPANEEQAMEQLVTGNNKFALQLYQELRSNEGNLFFSPYSISSALAMTYAGARDTTADQMAETLHFPKAQADAHLAFANLAAHFQDIQASGEVTLTIANALWLQQDFDVLESFLNIVKEQYQAGIFQVNFKAAYQDVRERINTWVAEQTNQKITDLLPPGTLSELTRLVLTNAIYFKGEWSTQFDPEHTQEEIFWTSPEKEVKTPLMHRKGSFQYGENDTVQILQIPYTGDQISMVVFLPKAKDGLAAMEATLSLECLTTWIEETFLREVDVFLPKFTLTSQFSLADTLKALGMREAFTTDADFSGIETTKSLNISDVIHKAFVEINEEGTEAAAATGVIIGVTSVQEKPEPIPIFKADHPFLFLIRDNHTGSLLFIGKMTNPA